MSLYIKKFGGSSVATPEKMIGVAKRVIYEKKENDRIVIVVSAMGNTTDELIKLAGKVTKEKHGREMDVLLATGEQVAI
ncbi:MAG: aspartate kinase, partial [Dialister micraerophilus]|nr:aspartate kinase [Dialister micraerophilus]